MVSYLDVFAFECFTKLRLGRLRWLVFRRLWFLSQVSAKTINWGHVIALKLCFNDESKSPDVKNERLAVWQRVAVGFCFLDHNVFDFVWFRATFVFSPPSTPTFHQMKCVFFGSNSSSLKTRQFNLILHATYQFAFKMNRKKGNKRSKCFSCCSQ